MIFHPKNILVGITLSLFTCLLPLHASEYVGFNTDNLSPEEIQTLFDTIPEEERQEQATLFDFYEQENLSKKKREKEITDLHSHFSLNAQSFEYILDQILGNDHLKNLCFQFKNIHAHLSSLTPDSDVHQLDSYICGSTGCLTTPLLIGASLNIDQDTLSWPEIKQALIDLFPQEFTTWYTLNDQELTIDLPTLLGDINTCIDTLPTELANHGKGNEIRQLFSRMVTLTKNFKDSGDTIVLDLLAQSISENRITSGGCLAGRINRAFIRYVSLLGAAGVQTAVQILE